MNTRRRNKIIKNNNTIIQLVLKSWEPKKKKLYSRN